jgi:hypothetical protein
MKGTHIVDVVSLAESKRLSFDTVRKNAGRLLVNPRLKTPKPNS